MAVCYNKLFKLLIDKKMTNAELSEKAGFSANIKRHDKGTGTLSYLSLKLKGNQACHLS